MKKRSANNQALTEHGVEKLLGAQTNTILKAVDGRLEKTDGRVRAIETHLTKLDERLDGIERRFDKLEERFDRKIDALMTTLDHFLKRLTDSELEFTLMKKDVNRMKTVLKEKLGVDLF